MSRGQSGIGVQRRQERGRVGREQMGVRQAEEEGDPNPAWKVVRERVAWELDEEKNREDGDKRKLTLRRPAIAMRTVSSG